MPPILVVEDVQTTRIIIDVPVRARGAGLAPVVAVTRTTVLHNDETGEVVATTTADTRVLSNVTSIPEFPAVHAALSAAIEATFNPPAPEPDPEPAP
jgi:hypothetical protein